MTFLSHPPLSKKKRNVRSLDFALFQLISISASRRHHYCSFLVLFPFSSVLFPCFFFCYFSMPPGLLYSPASSLFSSSSSRSWIFHAPYPFFCLPLALGAIYRCYCILFNSVFSCFLCPYFLDFLIFDPFFFLGFFSFPSFHPLFKAPRWMTIPNYVLYLSGRAVSTYVLICKIISKKKQ